MLNKFRSYRACLTQALKKVFINFIVKLSIGTVMIIMVHSSIAINSKSKHLAILSNYWSWAVLLRNRP